MALALNNLKRVDTPLNKETKQTIFWPISSSAFFKCFMSNSWVLIEPWTEPFIWSVEEGSSNSVNLHRVQVLNYSKYSLLLGLNLQPPEDFTQKYLPTKRLIQGAMYPCWIIQSEFLGLINQMPPSFFFFFFFRHCASFHTKTLWKSMNRPVPLETIAK